MQSKQHSTSKNSLLVTVNSLQNLSKKNLNNWTQYICYIFQLGVFNERVLAVGICFRKKVNCNTETAYTYK